MSLSRIGKFSEIFQKGFAFQTRVGISIGSFLRDDLALSPSYIKEKIATIFLDGKAVDSLETALLREGSTLALSSAMPGLAGATLRRDGPYATLRASITYRENAGNAAVEEGRITVKLFNLLIAELGPLFLEKGIILDSSELRDFFYRQGSGFRQGCERILLDGKAMDEEFSLLEPLSTENRDVVLRVLMESPLLNP
ncbi:hypothetical protein SAMN04489760_106110 [Syntrophus gentianae]|uniref:Uncharacterized protein n=1 Tax=Syntrophus gentianae TaxID=43775 RepID=A0A1H7WEJ3_9BACT|nr:hypothetical protein [Syntrophus gentianae]SEM19901.1 hypothetical protein SAMN04489760_106110 [Syntrophus gentianae]